MRTSNRYIDPSLTDEDRASMLQILEKIKGVDLFPEKTAEAERNLRLLKHHESEQLVEPSCKQSGEASTNP